MFSYHFSYFLIRRSTRPSPHLFSISAKALAFASPIAMPPRMAVNRPALIDPQSPRIARRIASMRCAQRIKERQRNHQITRQPLTKNVHAALAIEAMESRRAGRIRRSTKRRAPTSRHATAWGSHSVFTEHWTISAAFSAL